MIFFSAFLLVECWLCNLILQPTMHTDAVFVSYGLLLLNSMIFLMCLFNANHDDDWKRLNSILFFSFILRMGILLFDVLGRSYYVLPNSEGDAMGYHLTAISYAFGRRHSLIALTDYAFYIGQLYQMIGVQKITAQFINVCLSMYSIVFVYKAACLVNIKFEYRKTLVALLCFLPNFLLIDSILLQEAFVSFCISVSLYLYAKWWVKNSFIDLLTAVGVSLVGAVLHIGGAVCAIGFAVTMIFVSNKSRTFRITANSFILALVMLFSLLLISSYWGNTLFRKLGGEVSAEVIVEKAGATDRISNAEYDVGIAGLPPAVDLIVNSPIRMFYFICSPVPWMWRGISDLIAFWGSTIFYIATVIATTKYVLLKIPEDEDHSLQSFARVLAVVLLIATIMFGWGVSNMGTALRHREKFTALCALLYVVAKQGSSQISKRKI